jgi:hypothetical protein
MIQCHNEPCLFRLVYEGQECFLLLYVDDALITGQPKAVQYLQTQLRKHFDSKFETPKDFLGLDITRKKDGTIQLSMQTFTKKLAATFKLPNDPLEPYSHLVEWTEKSSEDKIRSKMKHTDLKLGLLCGSAWVSDMT